MHTSVRSDLIIAGCPKQAAVKVRIGSADGRADSMTDRCARCEDRPDERWTVGRRGKRHGGRGFGGVVEQRRGLACVTIDFVSRARRSPILSAARLRSAVRCANAVLAKSHTDTCTRVHTRARARTHVRCNHQSSHRVESDGWSACETGFNRRASTGEITPEIGLLFD